MAWKGPDIMRAFVVVDIEGERLGLVVEITELQVRREWHSDRISLEGVVISRHQPDERPDLDPPKVLPKPGPKLLPEQT